MTAREKYMIFVGILAALMILSLFDGFAYVGASH